MNNDLISRSALNKHLRGACVAKYPCTFLMGLLAAANETEAAPTVDAVPVRRGFNAKQKDCGDDVFECSICGYEDWDCMTCEPKHHNYCPNCGAKMDLEEH